PFRSTVSVSLYHMLFLLTSTAILLLHLAKLARLSPVPVKNRSPSRKIREIGRMWRVVTRLSCRASTDPERGYRGIHLVLT
ncbi:MAG TPA: hypothetical protein VN207_09735, partial [Ktedonobacteraceae bacterium]|nr:hypothetical protein [Ktedonobacteraceae bacterium]